jgi:hypothetical protein
MRHAPSGCLRALKLAMCRACGPAAAARLEALLLRWLRRCAALRTLKLRGASLGALQQLAEGGSSSASSSSAGAAGDPPAGAGLLACSLRELWFGEVLLLRKQRGGPLGWLLLQLGRLLRGGGGGGSGSAAADVQEAKERDELLGLARRLAGLKGLAVLRLKDYNYQISQAVKQELHAELAALLPGCMVWLQIG